MKIHECLGIREVVGVKFGLECETEGRGLPDTAPQTWNAVHDGSLRDGMEYVTAGTVTPENVSKELNKLHKYIRESNGEVKYSFRCSTHVHCNVTDLTEWQTMNCIFSYMLFENVFMNFVDKSRVGNRFCLRFQDAQQLTTQVCRMIEKIKIVEAEGSNMGMVHVMANLRQENLKYAALNLFTLKKYGTLEFRALEGTNDVAKINNWCIAIANWRKNAEEYANPRELFNAFMEDPEAMAMKIFGHAQEQFLKPGWKDQVEEGYSQNMSVLMYL